MIEFLLYLWGIETDTVYLLVCLQVSLFLLYLWGIETLTFSNSQYALLDHFYFTYEELKHSRIHLKRRVKSKFLLYLWGIETSFSCDEVTPYNSIFTLPMRNWNNRKHGFENALNQIFTLPMRNWNNVKRKATAVKRTDFYFTYEELKPGIRRGKIRRRT